MNAKANLPESNTETAELVRDAYDAVTLSMEALGDVSALFACIFREASSPHIKRLASIGQWLADDRFAHLEGVASDLGAGQDQARDSAGVAQ